MDLANLLEFNLVEIRLIQSLWEKKPIIYIANVLGRPYDEVAAMVKDLARRQKVKLFAPPSFERKVKKNEAREREWSKKQMNEQRMKVKDTTGLISVRINEKTIIQVKPGTDIESVKAKYAQLKKLS